MERVAATVPSTPRPVVLGGAERGPAAAGVLGARAEITALG
jgi:hypothetical protein